jgi:hypothetical protein
MANDAQIRFVTRAIASAMLVVLTVAVTLNAVDAGASHTPPGIDARLAGAGQVLSNFDVLNSSEELAVGFQFNLFSHMAEYAVGPFWNDQHVLDPAETTVTTFYSDIKWDESGMNVLPGEIAHFGYTVGAEYGQEGCPVPVEVGKEWRLESDASHPLPGTVLDWCDGAPPPVPLGGSRERAPGLRGLQEAGRFTPSIRHDASADQYFLRYAAATSVTLVLSDLMRSGAIWESRVELDGERQIVREGEVLRLARPLEPTNERWLVFMYEMFADAVIMTPTVTAFHAIWVEGSRPEPDPPSLSYFAFAGRDDPITSLFVQNLDLLRPARFEARLYPHEIEARSRAVTRSGIAPNAHEPLDLDQIETLQEDAYAVVIDADGRIASAAVHQWRDGPTAAVGQLTPGKELIVPLIVRNWVRQYSTVVVQNPDEGAGAALDVSLYQQGVAEPVFRQQYRIDAGRAITLDLMRDEEFRDLPLHFLGSMRLVARLDAELTAQAFVQQTTRPGAVYAYEALPPDAAASVLYAPLFRSDYWGYTGMNVANPNAESVEVEITFHGSEIEGNACAGQSYIQGPVTIAPYSAQNFWQGDGGGHPLPRHCFGSAVISVVDSGMGVLAIVNDSVLDGWELKLSAAYLASSLADAAPVLAVPYVSDHVGDWRWTSGVQIMNPSETDEAHVTMELYLLDGTRVLPCPNCSAIVKPGGAANMVLLPGNLGHVFAGERGSAIITGDRPLMAIVNTFANVEPFGQRDSSTYNAIPNE